MSDILPLEHIIGKEIISADWTKISPTGKVSYSWGDIQELVQWMQMKDAEISGKRGLGTNDSKYPLIWMITPIEGLIISDGNIFEGLSFVVASDTRAEWLNQTREAETMPYLVDISNYFTTILSEGKNTSIRKENGTNKIRFKKVYNYQEFYPEKYRSIENSQATYDIWDAIILKFDLIINNNCLKTLQLCL